ncbi:DNA cytosine methyltransferase [Staphylococcus shinii]|uniref:DNA cytosine methyltransferase n=1 Tax=Staphylococcus shinii TaxID=2912228 RepID=UPI00057C032C|nr:DNA cytosine methyltransferase [Staphylococcus shinii]
MNFIDICSGIGGFRTGLERNGHNCIAFAEIDKYAIQSYKAIYDTENEVELGDITTMHDSEWEQFKGNCDMIVGGTPCQSFSIAGKRLGFEDTRGTVFFSYVNAIKQVQPKYFLFENVKGLMSHDKGNTIKVILKAFDEVGYDLDFEVFNSKYYGVPQNRERIYIVGIRKDLSDKPFKPVAVGKKKMDLLKAWAKVEINLRQIHPQLQTEVTALLVDVLEDEVDEKYYLSEEKTKKLTVDFDPNKMIGIREATKQGYAVAEQGDSVNVSYPTSKTRRGRVGKQVAQTLQAGEVNQGVVMNDIRIRKLTPLECWRLQGFTDEQFYKAKDSGVSNSQLYKQAGNSVTVNVVDEIVKGLN